MKHRRSAWFASLALASVVAACESSKPRAQGENSRAEEQARAGEPQAAPEPAAQAPAPAAQESKPAAQVVVMEQDDEEPVHDGKWVYMHNCAGCHNVNGDGEGVTMLSMGLKARNFALGAFAFGNTRQAIFKTITSGVPGSSVMPAFDDILEEDERWLAADYVLTLCPKVDRPASGTTMKVGDLPAVARGLLPPVVEGKPEWPRGLLIGFPGGMTFEYRTDDVRLLAVREGEFVDRTDWNERGGSPLKPLGAPIWIAGDGDPGPAIEIVRGAAFKPASVRLKKTWNRADSTGLAYEALDKDGRVVARVQEELLPERLSTGNAFTRKFTLLAGDEPATIALSVSGQTAIAEWLRGAPSRWRDDVELELGPLPSDGWLVSRAKDSFECVHVTAPPNVQLLRDAGRVRLLVPVFVEHAGTRPAQIRVTIAPAKDWKPEELAGLSKEIAQ